MVNDILDDLCETTSDIEHNKRIEKMEDSWIEMDKRFTKNNPPNQFASYFEKFKQEQIKYKLTKFAKEKAGIKGIHWQNPVEWSNYMVKDEIRSHLGGCKSANQDEVINCLKSRNIRLIKDTVKALYGEGPYILLPIYQKFLLSLVFGKM